MKGHTLIVPKRHVASLFEATTEQMTSIWELLREVKRKLDERFAPDGYLKVHSTENETLPRFNCPKAAKMQIGQLEGENSIAAIAKSYLSRL